METRSKNLQFVNALIATSIMILLAAPSVSAKEAQAAAEPEFCEASWYGPNMELHLMPDGTWKPLTSLGKVFNMDDPDLVAHKEHPPGTRLRITNLDNGKVVVLTVKDHGPHVKGRCVDLSRAAAKNIGMYCGPSCGAAQVKVEVVGSNSK